MKKYTLILAALLLLTMPTKAERVTPETARKVATTFLNNNGAKTTELTDLSKLAGFPNLYIFSTESSFVVMAADDCVKPILGYSLTGKFDIDDMPENMRWWLQQYSDEIQWGIENNIQLDKSDSIEWQDLKEGKSSKDTPTVLVGPLLSTIWGQDAPYNNLCPYNKSAEIRTVTGCVATAMAQVMKYWNYPEQGQGRHSYTPENHPEYGVQSADFENTTYDWANMTNAYGSSSTDTQKQAVATLMYHCGVSVDMDYDYSQANTEHVGSAATSSDVASALVEYFKYSPSATYIEKNTYTNDQWIVFLKSELNENRPLFYRGRYENGGHAFVCDGYDSDNYFHFNWGWNGSDGNGTNNGYWLIGALNPGSSGTGSGQGTYNLYNAVIAWIEPLSNLKSPTISASATNSSIVLEWNVIAEATSYDIYRDNTKIVTNFTENSYTDNDVVSGVYYDYYVRAVSDETRSNPSNHVKKMSFNRDYTPANLTTTHSGSNAILNWETPENNLADLHYCIEFNYYVYGTQNYTDGTYWAQRFPASMLAQFYGMRISKISSCFYFASEYSLYVFSGSLTDDDRIYSQSFTKTTNSIDWIDFNFTSPLSLDCSKDLWIVFYNRDENVSYPVVCGNYNDEEASDVRHMSSSLETLAEGTSSNKTIAWLIRTYLTDGPYTYNIYDGQTKLNNDDITSTTYTHESPAANAVHQYIVKTKYYGGESAASNMAGLALGTASLESLELGENDNMTIAKNSKLTVSEAISNDKPENLILEDGAQLIHNTSGVKATVKKTIAPYTTNDNGWNFIASPVTENFAPSIDNGFLNGEIGENNNTYDLYYYDEPEHYWRNYEAHSQYFTIENKKGYLYSNEAATTLQFVGTLNQSNNSITINELSHSATELNGFNLVGNPFACNATIGQDCYVIEGRQVVLASGTKVFAPCEGAVVKATSVNNYSVTFTKHTGAKFDGKTNSLDLTVTQGKTTLDRARVRFSEGTSMEKFTFDDDNGTRLTFWQDGQDYAVAYANGLTELPLNFKAAKNGTYTLGIESNSLALNYLHLIDNMTGANIDLLATPSYTFEAKTSDYPSRFRLVFSDYEDAVGDNANFAYVSNGNIVVNEEGTLQIIDMTGRVVVFEDAKHSVSTSGMTAGVYVLRLITTDGVKTQKIVIE